MKAHKILARLVLIHGSEAVTIRKQGELCLPSAEMKFLRKTVSYSLLDHNGNEIITEGPKITPITGHIQQYKRNLLQHINQMELSRLQDKCFTKSPEEDRQDGDIRGDGGRP
jgi:hypothetical protein